MVTLSPMEWSGVEWSGVETFLYFFILHFPLPSYFNFLFSNSFFPCTSIPELSRIASVKSNGSTFVGLGWVTTIHAYAYFSLLLLYVFSFIFHLFFFMHLILSFYCVGFHIRFFVFAFAGGLSSLLEKEAISYYWIYLEEIHYVSKLYYPLLVIIYVVSWTQFRPPKTNEKYFIFL